METIDIVHSLIETSNRESFNDEMLKSGITKFASNSPINAIYQLLKREFSLPIKFMLEDHIVIQFLLLFLIDAKDL